MSPDEARAELLRLLQESPAPFPLDRAALLLAVDEYPRLDLRLYEQFLDEYAARVTEALVVGGDERDSRRRLGALRRVLFEEEGFHGDRENYYDVRNSYLNEVLDRKLGIPISLATVVLGVSRRLGWPMQGVNFPYHFLVRYTQEGEALAVDAFHGGLILGEEELEERWRFSTGFDPPSADRMLEPAEPRAVLVRMLNNVRGVHVRSRQYGPAALATQKVALIEPQHPHHQRDLGYLLLAAGDLQGAARHLERYLGRAPHASDSSEVRDRLAYIWENLPAGGEEPEV